MECHATFEGLHHWVEHSFTHLGWMVLAHTHKNYEKVKVYKTSLVHLKHCIENKIKETKDDDRKKDLEILHENVKKLITYSNKIMKTK